MTAIEYNQAVKEFSNRVCRFADKLVMNTDAAKDITQDAFMRLWENKDLVDFAKARSWLFTTAYRLALLTIERNKKHTGIEAIPTRMVEQANPDLKQIIQDSLKLLSDVQRSIILLRDYEGYNYDEIGYMLDLSESQVKVYLFRARQKIKDHIKDLKLVL